MPCAFQRNHLNVLVLWLLSSLCSRLDERDSELQATQKSSRVRCSGSMMIFFFQIDQQQRTPQSHTCRQWGNMKGFDAHSRNSNLREDPMLIFLPRLTNAYLRPYLAMHQRIFKYLSWRHINLNQSRKIQRSANKTGLSRQAKVEENSDLHVFSFAHVGSFRQPVTAFPCNWQPKIISSRRANQKMNDSRWECSVMLSWFTKPAKGMRFLQETDRNQHFSRKEFRLHPNSDQPKWSNWRRGLGISFKRLLQAVSRQQTIIRQQWCKMIVWWRSAAN